MVTYFFDSYAVIEVIKGNPKYAKYSDEVIVITQFNLVEVYWVILNYFNEDMANSIYEKFKDCVVELSDNVIQEAIKFRKLNKNKSLSYADCIGYIYAMNNKLLFLTGDKEFKNLKNVEFVQK